MQLCVTNSHANPDPSQCLKLLSSGRYTGVRVLHRPFPNQARLGSPRVQFRFLTADAYPLTAPYSGGTCLHITLHLQHMSHPCFRVLHSLSAPFTSTAPPY